MRYVLAVLSHGHPASRHVAKTLNSFVRQVDYQPEHIEHVHDGPGAPLEWSTDGEVGSYHFAPSDSQEGFCRATRRLWHRASRAATDRQCGWVFWLEHDFLFNRPVPIRETSMILRDASIAQVSLMRQPVNLTELNAGGVDLGDHVACNTHGIDWIRHRRYFTTNPSLMRAQFMQQNPWPAHEEECEGRFGLDLVERGYSFAILGDGREAWVEHYGHRNGKGY